MNQIINRTNRLLSLSFLVICVLLLSSFGKNPIPKGEHILWHDGGADYFALYENGMLYTVHDNKYHKIHKVHDQELVAEVFESIRKNDFMGLPAPLNREAIMEMDEENFKHIQYRKDGRVHEAYWTNLDEQPEPTFLIELFEKLMLFV